MKLSQIRNIMQHLPPEADPQNTQWREQYLRSLGLSAGELYQELEMESRFVDTHLDVSFDNSHVSLHSHDFYEILCCVSGVDVEVLVGAERYRLEKGDVLMIPPGISHRPLLPPVMREPYRRQVLWISRELMDWLNYGFPELMEDQSGYSMLLRTKDTPWEHLTELFQKGISESERQQAAWELAVLGNTVNLLAHLYRAFRQRQAGVQKAEKPEFLERILAYVEGNLGQKISLAETARHFFVSESTITQLFRKRMGVSFYRCVTQRRLIAAKTLIGEGEPLENVALQTGFQDYSSFYRAFKQEYGISPRQYRQLGNRANLSR